MKEKGAINDRDQAALRCQELKLRAKPYIEVSRTIETGITAYAGSAARKAQILELLNGTEQDWSNWKWQLNNRINSTEVLAEFLGLSDLEQKWINKVGLEYRWAISPYYLSLIDLDYLNSPIFKQAVPDIRELNLGGSLDPMDEALSSPVPCITRRYPDRLIINVTNQCAMFCRHCQRRRNIGEIDQNARHGDLLEAIRYIADNPEIRDVLITGGDAMLLSDRTLDWILSELHSIPHVEIKRIGTRTPVTMPQRITPELCSILRRYAPIYINTQFNHPLEVTPESKTACDMLIDAGVVLGNQAVLLKGINDDSDVMKKLNQELLKIRVRPYYIFHAKNVKGTLHWQTSIQAGLQLMEKLRGHTSGLAVPTYIVNAPGGLGKIPLMPNYIVDLSGKTALLRTWEGKLVSIDNPEYSSGSDSQKLFQ